MERDGDSVILDVVPDTIEEKGSRIWPDWREYTSPVVKNPLKSSAYGAEQTVVWIKRIFELLGMLVTGKFTLMHYLACWHLQSDRGSCAVRYI